LQHHSHWRLFWSFIWAWDFILSNSLHYPTYSTYLFIQHFGHISDSLWVSSSEMHYWTTQKSVSLGFFPVCKSGRSFYWILQYFLTYRFCYSAYRNPYLQRNHHTSMQVFSKSNSLLKIKETKHYRAWCSGKKSKRPKLRKFYSSIARVGGRRNRS
jgi:hypothetical protein